MVRTLGLIMVVWTILGSGLTALFLHRTADILTSSVRTDAFVERFAEPGNRAAPVFRFRALNGQEVFATYRGPSWVEWQIGQRVGVLFNTENPQIVIPDEPTTLFRMPVLAALATIVPLFFFWLLRMIARRQEARGG